jgi:predicted enzyme related to lactoylglutathione lyase
MVRDMALTARMVTIDCADPAGLSRFWTEATGYAVTYQDSDYVVLAAESGDGLQLGLQRVPEPKQGKNRVHVDWTAADRSAEVSRLTGLGATVMDEHHSGGFAWTVLADPAGNEFCVAEQD